MGPVLAMRRAACIIALLVAGCSSDPTGNSPADVIGDILEDRNSRAQIEAAPPVTAGLTRSDLAGITTPTMRATIPDIGADAIVFEAASNRGVGTWRAPDETTVMMDGPVLFATRGIGPDLLGAETDRLRALLEGGRSGTLTRSLRYLDGLQQISVVPMTCTLSPAGRERLVIVGRAHDTRRMNEQCTGPGGTQIANSYWLGGDGTLWQSRQFVSPDLGHLETQRLTP